MSPVQALRMAKEIVEAGWTRGYFARNENNQKVPIMDSTACKFCPVGAIYKVLGITPHSMSPGDCDAWDIAARCRYIFRRANGLPRSVSYWNDRVERTKEEVLQAFDRAIDYALAN